jgi:hypothetical protein
MEVAMTHLLVVLLAGGLIFLGCRNASGEESEMIPGLTPPDVELVELRRRELMEWADAQRPLPGQPAASAPTAWRMAIGRALARAGEWLQGEPRSEPAPRRPAFGAK